MFDNTCIPHGETIASKGIFVQKSTVDAAGMGLFAGRDFARSERITRYTGPVISMQEARRLAQCDPYSVSHVASVAGICVNGYTSTTLPTDRGAASVANHHFDAAQRNCKLVRVTEHRKDNSFGIWLVATRHIKSGEELFYNYGKDYWQRRGGN